jgi:hypothetical protein
MMHKLADYIAAARIYVCNRAEPGHLASFGTGFFVEVCLMSFKAGLFAPTHSKERDILANALFQSDSTLLKLGQPGTLSASL